MNGFSRIDQCLRKLETFMKVNVGLMGAPDAQSRLGGAHKHTPTYRCTSSGAVRRRRIAGSIV